MKPFQQYIFELNKPYEFRIKMAHIDPKSVMEQIKNALDSWELESVSAVKSHPIQEHRDFPQWGPCECWTFDIKLKYPTNQVQVAQILKERANLEPNWISVRNLHEAEFTEEAESVNADQKGALLDTEDLGGSKEGQTLVGQARIGSLLKELETREYEVAGSDTTVGGEKDPAYGKTTNELPMGDKAPVGSTQNKVYRKPRG
jgi:hypothetical protein